ncbi:MAG TPA: phosphatase domain-containing protein [Gemmatimonadaceae bacterium]
MRDLARDLGGHARRVARAVDRSVDRDPYHVVGYRGYATRWRALVLGRVLQDEGIAKADASHARWQNLLNVVRRLESDPMPHAKLRVGVDEGNATQELIADDEGFVHEWIKLDAPLEDNRWHDVRLELTGSAATTPVRGTAHVLVPGPAAAFGVISDMDDTVLQSDVTMLLSAARLMLLENSRTRLPFPGVASFYRALNDGTGGRVKNPIFYVSSSPWNLYDVIADFLDAHQIPIGPLLLRDWDLGTVLSGHTSYKSTIIREILDCYPWLPFILVGDSGQEDPEIYASIVAAYAGRIRAVYIRDVSRSLVRSAAIKRLAEQMRVSESDLVLAEDTLTLAQHAAAKGWIDPARLADVRDEKRR